MFYRVLILTLLIPAVCFSYTVVRKDGKTFSGELIEQNAEQIIIKDKDGITLKFKADQIDWNKTTKELQKAEAEPKKELKFNRTIELEDYRSKKLEKKWTGEPMTFDFKDIDVRDFFRLIADISGLNVILDPAVSGPLTIKLVDVPWDQALDLVCRNLGLGYEIDGNVISVDK